MKLLRQALMGTAALAAAAASFMNVRAAIPTGLPDPETLRHNNHRYRRGWAGHWAKQHAKNRAAAKAARKARRITRIYAQ